MNISWWEYARKFRFKILNSEYPSLKLSKAPKVKEINLLRSCIVPSQRQSLLQNRESEEALKGGNNNNNNAFFCALIARQKVKAVSGFPKPV